MTNLCSVCKESPCGHYNECPPGKRPYAQPEAGRRNVYMDRETLKRLQDIGDGNVSAGIRIAVKAYKGD